MTIRLSSIIIVVLAFFMLAATSSAGLNNGLVLYLPLYGNANDWSTNNNDGTVYGAEPTTDRFGNKNGAYFFDGTDDYILVPSSNSLKFNNSISVCLWIKLNTLPSDSCCEYYLVSKMYNVYPNLDGFNLAVSTYNNHNILFFRAAKSANWGDWHIGESIPFSAIPLNIYFQIVFTYDGTSNKAYLNGKLYHSQDNPGGNAGGNNEPLLIGFANWSSDSRHFKGIIDEVRIYNRALSELEIKKLYHVGSNDDFGSLIDKLAQEPFLLSEKEPSFVQSLSSQRLRILRNTVFARHGYPFTNRQLKKFFDKRKWYNPESKKIILSETDKENIDFIEAIEKRRRH